MPKSKVEKEAIARGAELIQEARKKQRGLYAQVKASDPRAKYPEYRVRFGRKGMQSCECLDYVIRQEPNGGECKHIKGMNEFLTLAKRGNEEALAHIGKCANVHY